jgi:polyferredoxin
LRKITQYLALFAAFALVIGSGRADWSGVLASKLMQIDPLATLASILAGRSLFSGAAWAMILLGMALLLGRAWCGWLCPLGTLLDAFSLRRLRGRRKTPPESWRKIKYWILLITLFAALFANLSLLVFDPLTIFIRTVSASLMPALDRGVTAAEAALYQVPALREGVKWFDDLVRPAILPRISVESRLVLLFGLVFLGIIALNVVAERFWCRYVCPMGGLLGLLSKIGLVRREVGEECTGCELCTRACPTGTIQPELNYASDPAECTLCLDCREVCPRLGISFPARIGAADWHEYDPSRRQALASFGAAVAGVGLLTITKPAGEEHPFLVQPPGARENDLLSKCVRCGICLAVCPTGGLQAAIAEAGIAGFWTPVLVSRMGFCNYACNACGENCPTGAIPALALEEKQQAVIGVAHVDQDRCLPWAEDTHCIVCEEMCPLPEKAVELEEYHTTDPFGNPLTLLQPTVIPDRCIGCGVCEYKCPVEGEAAIRVYSPEAVPESSLDVESAPAGD